MKKILSIAGMITGFLALIIGVVLQDDTVTLYGFVTFLLGWTGQNELRIEKIEKE